MTETLQKLTLSDEELREKILIHPTIKDENRHQKSVQWYGKKDMRIMDIPVPRITDPVCRTSTRCFQLFWGHLKGLTCTCRKPKSEVSTKILFRHCGSTWFETILDVYDTTSQI